VPFPIQSGSITERVRKFFRIRGKTAFTLDEVVAPVVIVQDLTIGPYQAGVTPCAGELQFDLIAAQNSVYALILNDKLGSVTEVLGRQFDDRSFSVTHFEMQNAGSVLPLEVISQLQFFLAPRAVVFAGVPNKSAFLTSIQNNDGTQGVPIEHYGFDAGLGLGDKIIWRGLLGDNNNTLGSRRTLEPIPNITIGPKDALCLRNGIVPTTDQQLFISIRGFYQEQPA